MLSYPALDKPQVGMKRQDGTLPDPKYQGVFVFTAGTDISHIKEQVLAVAINEWGKDDAIKLLKAKIIENPIRDGLLKYGEGSKFITARNTRKPQIVSTTPDPNDPKKPAIIPDAQIRELLYPGCFVNAAIRAYVYNHPMRKGITFSLLSLQRLGDGERIDNFKSAQDEFDVLEESYADFSADDSADSIF